MKNSQSATMINTTFLLFERPLQYVPESCLRRPKYNVLNSATCEDLKFSQQVLSSYMWCVSLMLIKICLHLSPVTLAYFF